ncbi:hypothetical protein V6B95_03585 [Thermoanaerobacterium saccharolyticum]|uniref:Uncharacterized protein n=1 Tax=Thermoanaerobacterium butyriciformans TaxID=1702242 RepID=A0ABS4NCH2_9THEO|nr:hypothetical protein [Thermoanaerobacterium butyriciformans]MBP2071387.1 hypothetical protein [Thermoanaerobacterium butyriciformans]
MILRKRLKNSRVGYQLIFVGALLISFTEIIRRYIAVGDFVDGLCIGIGIGLEILGIIVLRKSNNHQRVS